MEELAARRPLKRLRHFFSKTANVQNFFVQLIETGGSVDGGVEIHSKPERRLQQAHLRKKRECVAGIQSLRNK